MTRIVVDDDPRILRTLRINLIGHTRHPPRAAAASLDSTSPSLTVGQVTKIALDPGLEPEPGPLTSSHG